MLGCLFFSVRLVFLLPCFCYLFCVCSLFVCVVLFVCVSVYVCVSVTFSALIGASIPASVCVWMRACFHCAAEVVLQSVFELV